MKCPRSTNTFHTIHCLQNTIEFATNNLQRKLLHSIRCTHRWNLLSEKIDRDRYVPFTARQIEIKNQIDQIIKKKPKRLPRSTFSYELNAKKKRPSLTRARAILNCNIPTDSVNIGEGHQTITTTVQPYHGWCGCVATVQAIRSLCAPCRRRGHIQLTDRAANSSTLNT